MDPNATLEIIRELVAEADRPGADCSELAEHFEALDNWISNGGFLPEAWEGAKDENDYSS